MLKALIVAADSVTPEIIFGNPELFPTITRMIQEGASASYSAYVQKGYEGTYTSAQNWASIYTGLSPKQHGIGGNNKESKIKYPHMNSFNNMHPFWQVLGEKGIRTALWAADGCIFPVPINGYTVSVDWEYVETPEQKRRVPCTLQICDADNYIRNCIETLPPDRLYPKTLSQQGYQYSDLQNNADLAEEAVTKYHFQDSIQNFEEEMAYWYHTITITQKEYPADVLYFYTPTPDLIAHCCMYCDNNSILLECYQILDRYMDKFLQEFHPEHTIFLSDHGQQNFKNLVPCKNPELKREAFADRDKALWLKNGSIAFEASNGALLFSGHSLKGIFIAAGKEIKNTKIQNMRTLDIYPTILEVLGAPVPKGREGYVANIFKRTVINNNKVYYSGNIKQKSIAIIQTHGLNITDIIINELYIANRFAEITVAGEDKFREIFLGNPRVKYFIPYEELEIEHYDEIYCGIYYADSGKMGHVLLNGKNRDNKAYITDGN